MDMAVHAKLQNIVNLLIEHEAEPSTLKGKEKTNETAKAPDISIHDATKEGNIEAVKQHLDDGGDVNLTDNDGMTPLHFAAFKGHKEIVKVLIAEGADVSVSHDGYTPLHAAGNKEIAELLIAKGADVKAKEVDGETSLHYAASEGHKEVAELLIANGADVNVTRDDGGTPLYHAARWGHKNTTALLIAAGADVNAKDDKGRTPLDRAVGYTETADLLRKHGGKTAEELKALMPR
jgi:ankyrin repeat protein